VEVPWNFRGITSVELRETFVDLRFNGRPFGRSPDCDLLLLVMTEQ
jgi:hypothetical protein